MRSLWARLAVLCATLFAQAAPAETVTLIDDDLGRFQAHLWAANAAQKELDVAFAFISDDTVTQRFLFELVETAKRTPVRLLLDYRLSTLKRETVAYLEHNGVKVRYFHAPGGKKKKANKRLSWLWKRMHDKLVISDDVLLMGTENMGANHYPSLAPREATSRFRGRNLRVERDLQMQIEGGDAVSKAKEYFNELWESDHVSPPPFSLDLKPEAWLRVEKRLNDSLYKIDLRNDVLPPNRFEVAPEDIEFLSVFGAEARPEADLRKQFLKMLREAKEPILIETPYLLPDPEVREILVAKAADGLPVTILCNSSRTNNHPALNPVYASEAQRLKALGIDVRTWDGDDTIHGKALFVGDRDVLVMTMNLNRRSMKHDLEIGIRIRGQKAVAAVSKSLGLKGYSPLVKASLLKRCLLSVGRALVGGFGGFEGQF